jgi:hypothetical protein
LERGKGGREKRGAGEAKATNTKHHPPRGLLLSGYIRPVSHELWAPSRASCQGRMKELPHLMSSKPWAPTRFDGGVLAPDPAVNPLWDANKVYLPYCTSDGFVGNRAASEATFGWHFRGQVSVMPVPSRAPRSRGSV